MSASITHSATTGRDDAMDDPDWWRQAVVYQIYPRSFKDSTGNGIGDIRGITERMDHLSALGVDAIWLSPFYPSPLEDGGYDVADYRNVDPLLGTMQDFAGMVSAAHDRHIRVIVDLVPNHTSSRHPWFQEALHAPRESSARDRYIFRDGRGANGELPPTDWTCGFGGPAWERVEDGQWYLHMWSVGQPDLNWNNEEVRRDYLDTIRFWSDCGVDGFRVDAAQSLVKDMDRDDLNDWSLQYDALPSDGSHPMYDRNELHDVYREWRRVFNEYDPPRFAVAEAWVNPARQYLYASADELGQVFNFEFAKADWTAEGMRRAIASGLAAARESGSTTTWVMSNHDVPRHASRYGLPQVPARGYHQIAQDWLLRNGGSYMEDRALGTHRARAAILLELALPGSAYIYQGEELGLFEVADIPWTELEDPTAFHSGDGNPSATRKGRDGCRVPLPWRHDAADGFGFSPAGSGAEPHLPQPAWFSCLNAQDEADDPDSMLALYRRAIAMRKTLEGMTSGTAGTASSVAWRPENGGDIIAFERGNWICITNFGAEPTPLPQGEVVLSSAELMPDSTVPSDATVWLHATKTA